MVDMCDYAKVAETLGWNGGNAFFEVRRCFGLLSGEVRGGSLEETVGDLGPWLAKSIAK